MPDRELSPYSARVALTQQLQQGGSQSASAEHKSRPWDTRGPPERRQNGHNQSPVPYRGRGRGGRPSPPPGRGRERSEKSRLSPPRSTRDASLERTQKAQSKDASVEPARSVRDREASPEPYRKPREASSERKRDRSKGRDRSRRRDHSKDRHHRGGRDGRGTSKDRDRANDGDRVRQRNRSKDRDRSRDRRRVQRRERSGERMRDSSRERKRSRDREERRDRSKDRHRDRSRSRDKDRHRRRDRDRSKDRRSRSPRALKRRSHSASPPSKRRRKYTPSSSRSRSPSPRRRSKKPLPDQEISFRGSDNSALPPTKYGGAPANLEKPNFKPTGLLAKAANKVEGTKISLKYHEPPEARKPPSSQAWRIIVFKGEDVVDTIELGTKSCWLLGRSAEVVDYVLEHPSSSGQHAVIQFRYVTKTVEDEYGVKKVKGKVKPYIIDLESSNGTELNGERVETSRYLELRDKDILKFAGSEREYVVVLPPPEERKE